MFITDKIYFNSASDGTRTTIQQIWNSDKHEYIYSCTYLST